MLTAADGRANRRARLRRSTYDAEKLLAEIWCEVLELERVGIHDDFFALGGCSTHSMEVTVKAEAAGMPLTPEAVFVCSTIADLAAEYGRERRCGRATHRHPATVDAVDALTRTRPSAEEQQAAPTPVVAAPTVSLQTRNTVIESIGHLSARGGGVDGCRPSRLHGRGRHPVGTPDRHQEPAGGRTRRVLHRPRPAGDGRLPRPGRVTVPKRSI